MLTINQPKVIAETQDFQFDELHITGGANGQLVATISFIVNDENGKRIDTKVLTYSGEEFNTFWSDFNSGKYLYEQLVEKQELDVTVPSSIEESFENAPTPEVVESPSDPE